MRILGVAGLLLALALAAGLALRLLRKGDLARLTREIERHILRLRDRRKARAA